MLIKKKPLAENEDKLTFPPMGAKPAGKAAPVVPAPVAKTIPKAGQKPKKPAAKTKIKANPFAAKAAVALATKATK